MRIFEITYEGKGSEKQVAWATNIFEAEIDKIKKAYDYALFRVAENTMPQKWTDEWAAVLNDEKVVKAIEAFSKQPAGVTIDYKGLRGPRGKISIAAIVEKIVTEAYQK